MLAVSLVFCGAFWFGSEYRHIQDKLAYEQMEIFYLGRERALRSAPDEAAMSLMEIRDYYPSGTKQTVGSPLDAAVELVPSEVMRDVVIHLQNTSGQTLGDDPDTWIRFYVD